MSKLKSVVQTAIEAGDAAALHDVLGARDRLPKSLVATLIKGGRSSDWRIRASCVAGLGKCAPTDASVALLVDSLDAEHRDVVTEAARALLRIGGDVVTQNQTKIVAEAKTLWSDKRLWDLAQWVEHMDRVPPPAPDVLAFLVEVAEAGLVPGASQQPALTRAALRAIGALRDDEARALAVLQTALDDWRAWQVVAGAVEGLLRCQLEENELRSYLLRAVATYAAFPGLKQQRSEICQRLAASRDCWIPAAAELYDKEIARWHPEELLYFMPGGTRDVVHRWVDAFVPEEETDRDTKIADLVQKLAGRKPRRTLPPTPRALISVEPTTEGWRVVQLSENDKVVYRLYSYSSEFDTSQGYTDEELVDFGNQVAEDPEREWIEAILTVDEKNQRGELEIELGSLRRRFRDGNAEELDPYTARWFACSPCDFVSWVEQARDQLRVTVKTLEGDE